MVLEFGHFGGDVDFGDEIGREVAAGEAEIGFLGAISDDGFEVLALEQPVCYCVVDFVADDEVVIAGSCGLKGEVETAEGGFDVCFLVWGLVGDIEALAFFVMSELVREGFGEFGDRNVFGCIPCFDELDEGDAHASAERAQSEPERGRGFALAFASVGDDDGRLIFCGF